MIATLIALVIFLVGVPYTGLRLRRYGRQWVVVIDHNRYNEGVEVGVKRRWKGKTIPLGVVPMQAPHYNLEGWDWDTEFNKLLADGRERCIALNSGSQYAARRLPA